MADLCIPCWMQLHEECYEPGDRDCCCHSVSAEAERVIGPIQESSESGTDTERVLSDPISTGRKRAAQLKPIIEGMVCEWANLAYAGGGPHPIVGCRGNVLTKVKGNEELTGNIHHGPDKSTLNNSDSNLHRICGKCHNRWHTLNDPLYADVRPANGEPFVPLDGSLTAHDKHTLATPGEIEYSEAWWKMPKEVRTQIPFRKVEDNE